MKKLVIISALILTIIMGIAFIAGVTAVTDTTSVDPASLSLSLFNKKPSPTITGNAVDDFGNTIATVTVKAGEEVGILTGGYGTNTHGYYMSDSESWSQNLFLDSEMDYIRADMSFDLVSTSEGVYESSRLTRYTNLVTWAKENDKKIMWIASYMPGWLADTTIVEANCSTNNKTCPPSNYTKWNNLVLEFLSDVGCDANTCMVEVWNEPENTDYFLSDTATTVEGHNIRVKYYNLLYNSTYDAIKLVYPTMEVGGPGGNVGWTPAGTINNTIITHFIGNFSDKMDFLDVHIYTGNYDSEDRINYWMTNIIANCTDSATCPKIFIGEWNVLGYGYTNTSSESKYANAYFYMLNNPSLNVSMIQYEWAGTSLKMINSLKGTTFAPYNLTKNMAHYHAGGNMIVNSSSNNNSIKSVASLNPQGIWHITVINTATNNINVNINVSSTGVQTIKDLATVKIYPVSDGIANVGILKEYDVKHYEGIADYEVEKEVVISSGGYSVGKNKIVSVKNLNINPNEFAAIKTDTSIVIPTSEIFVNTYTADKNTKEEKEEFYGPIQSEEDINEINYKSRTGSLSLAVSNNSYLVILIILLGSIICTALIISIIYRKKKREADKVKRLMDWVDNARALGYSNDKMKEMLAQYNWDKELVENVIGR